MKELDFIEIIKRETKNEYIGDDCAYLKEHSIVISQDNFIEDIHFKKDWATPFQIGYKAAAVNISDILASGAKPQYLSIGLSIPNTVDNNFIKELYKGIKKGSYGAKIIGGDITGGDKIFISITAIGSAKGRNISSRKYAKPGYIVITHGKYGESMRGLSDLKNGKKNSSAIRAHLEPKLEPEFSEQLSTQIKDKYAMMDTSDGLADALYKIAHSSECTIKANEIKGIYGYEDYHLVAAVPESAIEKLKNFYIIGEVTEFDGTYLHIGNKKITNYDELGVYNHFE